MWPALALQLGLPILGGLAGRLFRKDDTQDDLGLEGRRTLHQLLQQQLTQARQPAGSSTSFHTARASLSQALDDRARVDAQSAAARGLTGTNFELAQQNNRNKAFVQGLRGVLADESNRNQATQAQTLSQLLSLQGLTEQAGVRQQALQDRNRAGRDGLLASIFTGVGQTLAETLGNPRN